MALHFLQMVVVIREGRIHVGYWDIETVGELGRCKVADPLSDLFMDVENGDPSSPEVGFAAEPIVDHDPRMIRIGDIHLPIGGHYTPSYVRNRQ